VTSTDITAALRESRPGSHIVLFYDFVDLKRGVIADYIADGLNNGRGIGYVCSDEKPADIRKSLAKRIDVEPNEKSGNLLIRHYDEWYIENGIIDNARILKKWEKAQENFEKKGLGTRVVGESSGFFAEGKVKDRLRYEYAFSTAQPIKMEALCVYDIRDVVSAGYTDVIKPIIHAHGKAIFVSKNGSGVVESGKAEDDDVKRLLEID